MLSSEMSRICVNLENGGQTFHSDSQGKILG